METYDLSKPQRFTRFSALGHICCEGRYSFKMFQKYVYGYGFLFVSVLKVLVYREKFQTLPEHYSAALIKIRLAI